jgi:ABC-type iron transport system FetAB ATPase subunit
MIRDFAAAAGVVACVFAAGTPAFAQKISLATNASGITIGGSKPIWLTGFGSINGLGLGTPGTGQTILTVNGGVLYTSPYNIVVTAAGGVHKAVVKVYVSANFVHSSILEVYSCTSSCTTASNYGPISTNVLSPTDVIASPGSGNATVTRSLGVFVSNQNGAAAFTGTDSATVTYEVFDASNNSLQETHTLGLSSPNENMQTSLRLVLSTAPGGRTISTASDFSISYGTVNALGISPGTNLTTTAVSGGQLYSTPYQLQPTFAGFSSTSGTLTTYVSTDFAHPLQLELRDSSNGSSFSAISKASGSQTTLTSSAASSSTVTRHLGLFVSNTNGATVFNGADNATVTFTLVVP